jgi:hypothetical protein
MDQVLAALHSITNSIHTLLMLDTEGAVFSYISNNLNVSKHSQRHQCAAIDSADATQLI